MLKGLFCCILLRAVSSAVATSNSKVCTSLFPSDVHIDPEPKIYYASNKCRLLMYNKLSCDKIIIHDLRLLIIYQ